jgi:hypothetical protein
LQNLRGAAADGNGSGKQSALMMSLGKESASDVLDNLEIGLDGPHHDDDHEVGNDELQISEICMDN